MIRRAYGSAVIAAHLRGQKQAPFLPREEVDKRRDARVRRIVRYAAEHVPAYRGIGRIDTAADLERKLPLIDRDELRAHPERWTADIDGLVLTTSGTTGTRLRVVHDRRSVLANFAYGERERVAVNKLAGGDFRPRELYVGYLTSTMHQVSDFYAQATLMPVRPRRNFVDIDEPIERIAERMLEERPDLLVGYGGWVNLFFRTVQARALEIAKPKLVMSMGEALPHGGRELIEDELGIPVMQRYNAVEALKIGFYCEERTGFHLHEDLTHVRVAGDGAIVLSNLVNRGTVLLNYPIGDVGTITTEPCPCGRTFHRLETLEGRAEDIVELPGGRFVHPRQVWEVMKAERGVLQYQLIQEAPDRFVLEVAGELPDTARLSELLGGAAVDVRRRPEEPRRGKFRAVVALR